MNTGVQFLSAYRFDVKGDGGPSRKTADPEVDEFFRSRENEKVCHSQWPGYLHKVLQNVLPMNLQKCGKG